VFASLKQIISGRDNFVYISGMHVVNIRYNYNLCAIISCVYIFLNKANKIYFKNTNLISKIVL